MKQDENCVLGDLSTMHAAKSSVQCSNPRVPF